MNHNEIVRDVAHNLENGNRTDAVNLIRDLPPLDAALVAATFASKYPHYFTVQLVNAIEARL